MVTAVPVSPVSSWALRCLRALTTPTRAPPSLTPRPQLGPAAPPVQAHTVSFILSLLCSLFCGCSAGLLSTPSFLPNPTLHQGFAEMAVGMVTLLTGRGFPPVVIMLLPNRLPGVVGVQACFSVPRGSLRAGMSLPSTNSSCRGPSGCGWLRNACWRKTDGVFLHQQRCQVSSEEGSKNLRCK